jgi:hypothetical protein
MTSCWGKSEIIESNNVKSIVVTSNDDKFNPMEITNSDSIKFILKKLNNVHQEPIKFYATHRVNISYNDGKQILVLFNGPSMKVDGHTYKMNESIKDMLTQ